MNVIRAGFAFAILHVFAAALAGCGGGAPSPRAAEASRTQEPIAVSAIRTRTEAVVRRVELVGTLEGNQEVLLSSEVAGRVSAIRADLGDRVEKGQVLIEIDPTEYQLGVDRQKAALGQVFARLGVSGANEPMPDPENVSAVRRAAADLAEARVEYERSKALLSKGVASRQVLDGAEARFRVAEADYSAALEEVRNLKAQIHSLQAQLEIALKSLADTRIRAPFGGTVRERRVEVGQYVKDQTPLIDIASTQPLKLRAEVPERWFPHVREGAAVEISVDAYPGEAFSGKVSRMSRSIDPGNRSFTIEATVDNRSDRLRPGLFARAFLTSSKVDSVVRIPADAVVSFYGVNKVYLIANETIEERVVMLGDRAGEAIEVTEGLAADVLVATSELARLRQGSRVVVKKEL
jgi:multidrug efflux pump subunit AcrA (membrane-fusion protein)